MKRNTTTTALSVAMMAVLMMTTTVMIVMMLIEPVQSFSTAKASSFQFQRRQTTTRLNFNSATSSYFDQLSSHQQPQPQQPPQEDEGNVPRRDELLEDVNETLGQLYGVGAGIERMRRLNAAMAKSTYLQVHPNQDKRHMTYGEIPLEIFTAALKRCSELVAADNTQGQGSFIDLGSGVGRLVFAASMLASSIESANGIWTESVGVEIVPDLHITAMEALHKAESIGIFGNNNNDQNCLPVKFFVGDAFDPTNSVLSEASTIYAYSTTWECDEDGVMVDLSKSLSQCLSDNTLVAVTDRKLSSQYNFVYVDSIEGTNVEKGGSTAKSTVNIYKFIKQ